MDSTQRSRFWHGSDLPNLAGTCCYILAAITAAAGLVIGIGPSAPITALVIASGLAVAAGWVVVGVALKWMAAMYEAVAPRG